MYVYYCVLCLIVVPLPQGKNPFAVPLNKITIIIIVKFSFKCSASRFESNTVAINPVYATVLHCLLFVFVLIATFFGSI
jgi:hypothetical protein